MDQTATAARAFEAESYRIDQLVWDAMALRAGESALFCGLSNNIDWIKRAVAIGVKVSVIANETATVGALGVPITLLRGSTSMLPSRAASFDATVAFHYLHEVDPFFHASIVSELARVGKRCVIVEPAPPSDPLGLRIASLYSRAKRQLGQFENYHQIDYWRKLLAIVKPDVTYQTFTFMRTPPREAIRETVALIIDTMAAEETPETYLAELRALAKRPDGQLLPQARYVIVGTAAGKSLAAGAGTDYREKRPQAMPPRRTVPAISADIENDRTAAESDVERIYSRADTAPEFPAVEPPPSAVAPATASEPVAHTSRIARNAFGLSREESAAAPATAVPAVTSSDEDPQAFGLPDRAADAAEEFGWEWETPGSS